MSALVAVPSALTGSCTPAPDWAEVTALRKDEKGAVKKSGHASPNGEMKYIKDLKTGDLYMDDPRWLVTIKCGLIFAATPLFTMGHMLWHFGKVFVDPKNALNSLWNVVRAPFFAIGVMFAALYGFLINAYDGRKLEAQVEHAWQHGARPQQDLRETALDEKEGCWKSLVYRIENSKAFYLAWCFQPRHNIKDPDIIMLKA